MRARLQNLALLLGTLTTVLALAECGLRLHEFGSIRVVAEDDSLRIPHPVRGWTLEAGGESFRSKPDYSVLVRMNEQGWRDRTHAIVPAPGVFRIVVIGDSFMEAYQVPLEASLPYRLQEELAARRVEVINLGVGGYGTAQEFLALRDEGLRYRPDLVVLAFFTGNDVRDNSAPIQALGGDGKSLKRDYRPFAAVAADGRTLEWTLPRQENLLAIQAAEGAARTGGWRAVATQLSPVMLADRLQRARSLWRRRVRHLPEHDPNVAFGVFLREFVPELSESGLDRTGYRKLWEDAWAVTRLLLTETARLARDHGAGFAVLLVPERLQVEPELRKRVEAENPGIRLDPLAVNRRIAEICATEGIALVDPTPAFVAAHESGRVLYHQIEDRHWNSAGHALATRELILGLDERGLLPHPPTP